MRSRSAHAGFRLVEYDALRRRLWILGQRCYHGATGSVVAAAACLAMIAPRHGPRSLLAVALAGRTPMVHDWKDRSMWLQRGRGTQP